MFDQAIRLLREKWEKLLQLPGQEPQSKAHVQQLAEELFVILTAPTALEHEGPLTVRNTAKPEATESPLNLFPPLNIPGITINNQDGTTTTVGENGVENTDAEGNTTRPGGGGLVGRIVSGSGQTYVVNLFENGLSAAATRQVSASAPYLDEDEQLSEGDIVGVNQAGVEFVIQIGYWL